MNVYEIVTERIIEQLQRGVAPWRKPWTGTDGLPTNLVSGKAYRGINVWLLSMAGYASPYWVTYKQAQALGGNVRKGEKATPVVYYSRFDTKDTNPDGSKRQAWVIRYYSVFNVAQCDGLTVPDTAERPAFVPLEEAARIVEHMPHAPKIEHGKDGAYYRPSADSVGMPDADRFDTSENYYSTLFHELAHSTGHTSRLDRPEVMKTVHFGSADYSREELVAEMGAAYLCAQAGITATLSQHAAYLENWIKALRGDSQLVVRAASAAQKAADYIMGTSAQTEETV
jgi:antirestriction protein ArdC